MKNKILKFVSQRYFTIVNLILLTLFVGISIGTMYNVLTTIVEGYAVSPVDLKDNKKTFSVKARKKTLASYSNVAKRNLFKTTSAKAPGDKQPIVEDLELTDLKLKLWGTIVAGKAFSRAIIEETKTRKQQLYKIGDSIQTAKLTHILRSKVVLTVNGKDEILEIEQKSGTPGRRPRESYASSEPGPVKKSSRNISVKRSLIDESMQNLNQLMKDVRIRPHFKNGESDGLIVSGIKGGSVFRKLGLRNGDIIMGVDGSKIESVDDAMKLYSGLSDLEKMQVDIKRRGKLQTLNFNIE